jgi:chitin disaccharide deacetylase
MKNSRPRSTANAIRMITRADDVGSFHSANVACYDAYKQGILRNGGFIVPAGRFREAVEMFKDEKGFCCGVHAALTCEWTDVRWRPILPPEKIRSVVRNDGTLHYTTMDLFKNGAVFKEMLAEIQAQVDLARKAGLNVQYVDSHMNFLWHFERSDQHRFEDAFHRWAEREGLVSRVKLTGYIPRPIRPGKDPIKDMAARIRSMEPGTYILITHPCYDDPEMATTHMPGRPVGEQAKARDVERRMFMDPAIVSACSEKGVQPIRYIDA